MSKVIEAWTRYQQRKRYDGPDGLVIGGQKVTCSEEQQMIQKELPQNHLNNVLRMVLRAETERVWAIRNATHTALKRLRVGRDLTKAVKMAPAGSDQCNMRSVFDWLDKIEHGDTAAIAQVIQIDATCCSRTS